MAMAWVWTVMAAAAVIFGALTGRMAQVGAAALEGARSAVELCLSMAGVVCLWTGVMEVMERCGLAGGLARLRVRLCGGSCRRRAATVRRSRPSRPTSRRICSVSATPRRRSASALRGGWPRGATVSRATSYAGSWC